MSARLPTDDFKRLDYSALNGWADAQVEGGRAVFQRSAAHLGPLPAPSPDGDFRAYLEAHFTPVILEPVGDARITGYYEPELSGARTRSDAFPTPIYRAPPNLPADRPWLSRQQIEETGALDNQGLELAWIANPAERFFLQVQGSGRIRFADGQTMRVGFAAKNGHAYRSIGAHMLKTGLMDREHASAQTIKAWLIANPGPAQAVMRHNPSYVFFREIDTVSPEDGPLGTLGLPVTAMRSVAVDPNFIPLGLPVWVSAQGNGPRGLMIAQDTGSAIKGGQRVDVFTGTGDAAGDIAGKLNTGGQVVALVPNRWLA